MILKKFISRNTRFTPICTFLSLKLHTQNTHTHTLSHIHKSIYWLICFEIFIYHLVVCTEITYAYREKKKIINIMRQILIFSHTHTTRQRRRYSEKIIPHCIYTKKSGIAEFLLNEVRNLLDIILVLVNFWYNVYQ